MTFKHLSRGALAAVLSAAAVGAAQAATVTLDVSGIFSNDEFGAAINETRVLDLVPFATVTGLTWNVTLSADAPSWLSEMMVDFSDGAAGVTLNPGFAANTSGQDDFSGSEDLVATNKSFQIGASGQLLAQFFEKFDDFSADFDGVWLRGTITVAYVPEPATFGVAALGLLGLAAARRRRNA